ncbi:MAG: hypothetical protein JWO08_3526 [Verrucomicrobiaceae bacterium]|nr:hypothetical protein [Verrucomicrobiaceae bacterium]
MLPVIPCSLPADVWDEAGFAAVKTEVYRVSGHLNREYEEIAKQEGKTPPSYNLVADFGTIHKWRTLLGGSAFGAESRMTYSFGTTVLLNIPYVILDCKNQALRLTPANSQAFLKCAASAKVDPVTKSYVLTGANPSVSTSDTRK